jgi:hypothetical protein
MPSPLVPFVAILTRQAPADKQAGSSARTTFESPDSDDAAAI